MKTYYKFNGQLPVIIQSTDEAGEIEVIATSTDLKTGTITINAIENND
ncbi:MAG: hypothetical protein KJO96_04615 [Winogradskyella sp.]|nr:hypothetical protein [Winogradskyella sp.]